MNFRFEEYSDTEKEEEGDEWQWPRAVVRGYWIGSIVGC